MSKKVILIFVVVVLVAVIFVAMTTTIFRDSNTLERDAEALCDRIVVGESVETIEKAVHDFPPKAIVLYSHEDEPIKGFKGFEGFKASVLDSSVNNISVMYSYKTKYFAACLIYVNDKKIESKKFIKK